MAKPRHATRKPCIAKPAPDLRNTIFAQTGGAAGTVTGTAPPAPPPAPDTSWMDQLGLPPDVRNTVTQILVQDPQGGKDRALAYIRGTAWYQSAFPGIGNLVASGVISGGDGQEGAYNVWKNQIGQSYQQYYGRPPTQAELMNFANSGYSVNTINQIGSGHAWAAANSADVQYVEGAFDQGQLTDNQLQTLGEQNAGRDSALGQILNTRFQTAMAKMQKLFEGQLATPSTSLQGGRLSAPSLNPNQGNQSDIGR